MGLKGVATKAAESHDLDPVLVWAVCAHESGWNPNAARYEPQFDRWLRGRIRSGAYKDFRTWGFCSRETELKLRSMSLGLMQCMGQVAREYGFRGYFLTDLCIPEVGLEYGCRKLADCMKQTSSVRDALLRYNGGGDPEYPDKVLRHGSDL